MASIQRIDGKTGGSYRFFVSTGRDSDGKQIRHTKTWTPSPGMTERQMEKAAQKAAADFERAIEQGYVADDRQSFQEYAEYVLDLKERSGAKHKTIESYRFLLGRINPAIGFMKLQDIRPQHLNQMYKNLARSGQRADQGRAIARDDSIPALLKSLKMSHVRAAAEAGTSPAEKATPPKVTRKEVNYFQPDELCKILDALDAEPIKWRTIVNLLIVTGCRRGEIAGLKWKNVDFKNGKIKIDSTLLYSKDRGIYENATKTGDTRFLKLPAETMALLKDYRQYWLELRFKNGDRWQGGDYVFTRDDGSVIHPDSLTAYLNRFSEQHPELPHINPHAFRHTVASVLINAGQDIVTVSRRFGHSRTSTTLDVYSHLIAEADADASEVIADALLRRKA